MLLSVTRGTGVHQAGQTRRQFLRTVPAAERISRQDLVRVANSSFSGFANNAGRNAAPYGMRSEIWDNER
jgi:hypothetical protein